MRLPSRKSVQAAQKRRVWDLANSVLYRLCKEAPKHKSHDQIIAKVILIGRAYAAAIERRKVVDKSGDDFYLKTVAPKIADSKIDRWIARASSVEVINLDTAPVLLEVHSNVTELFSSISGMQKRSLAAKYLHFHLPNHFFIFDSRASAEVKRFSMCLANRKNWLSTLKGNYDEEYAKFFWHCLVLREAIEEKYGYRITPREIDNLFLHT